MNYEPRNEALHPPTKIAADGKTVLKRYRVDAVIYAANSDNAKLCIDQAGMYIEAARFIKDD